MKIARSTCPARRMTAVVMVVLLGLSAALLSVEGRAQSDDRGNYVLATATPGGTFHPVGVAFSTLVKVTLLPEQSIDLTAIDTAGSLENIRLLSENKAQFALLSGLVAYQARAGTGPFADAGPQDDLQAIANLWVTADHFVIKEQYLNTGTIEDFLALKGRRVSVGREKSGTLIANRLLMQNFGVDLDAEYELAFLNHTAAAEALGNGEIDGMNTPGGIPVTAVTRALTELGDDVAVLEFTDEQLAQADAGLGLWIRQVIPAGTYPGQTREIRTAARSSLLAVRADADEEVVYQITKTIFENLPFLHNIHDATKQIAHSEALKGLPLPAHPGALRYYHEVGLEIAALTEQASGKAFLRSYQSPDEARGQVNKSTVGIISGGPGETGARITADLAAVLDQGDDLRIVGMNGKGSAQNITDLLYLRGVDAAIVQTDVLEYAKAEEVYPNLTNQITYITKLYGEEFHLLVRDDVQSIQDLVGKKVNLGSPGSGDELTAAIVFNALQIPVQRTAFDPTLAIEKLKAGEIAAAVYVSGKPMPLLANVAFGDGIRLLAVPFVDYAETYAPARLTFDDYPNLVPAGEGVETLAVSTALAVYNWKPGRDRYAPLARFIDAFFGQLTELQATGRHPKWLEVDPAAELPGWQRFTAAADWLEQQSSAKTGLPTNPATEVRGATPGDAARGPL